MKPKEYLKSIGIDTGGRGRMPKAHVALIHEAVAKGVAIEGYAAATSKSTGPVKPDAKPVVEKVAVTGIKTIADIPAETHDERVTVAKVNGKVIGMRTVCQGCRNSLTYCWCERSTVLDGETLAVVQFGARTDNGTRINRWW